MATKKKTAKKTEKKMLVLDNGERFEVTNEDGRFFYCGERAFAKNHPMLVGIEEDAKEQEQTEGE